MTEFLGPDAKASFGVARVGELASVVAVLEASFPSGTDPDFFAEGFDTRDYFRWQMDLGEMPGVGTVQSEPCTILGAEAPGKGVLPPNLMISFAVTGDVEAVVPDVVQDLKQRLARTIQPTEVLVGILVTLEGTTPGSVKAEIERWRSRGCQVLELEDEALRRPMASTRVLFEFPTV